MTETALETQSCKKLPLHQEHERLGARMGAFGSWLVPLYYTSIIEEHHAVRTAAGIFDISHMGEFYVRGKRATEQVNFWIANDVTKIANGQALYSPACHPSGGIVDDLVVLKFNPEIYYLVVNASNVEKDFGWFESNLIDGAVLENVTDETGLLALQGPKSSDILRAALLIEPEKLSYYHFLEIDSEFGNMVISETGYTGEKGYEIFCPIKNVCALWQCLSEKGKTFGLRPIGFGARDTLRLEAKLPLYGHDLTDETTPLEAGLAWTVGWAKKDFIGKPALETARSEGIERKLIGFEMEGRGIARQECVIRADGRECGKVTSGSFSPTLKKNIGLGYVTIPYSGVGQELEIQIRDRWEKAKIVKTPFYKR